MIHPSKLQLLKSIVNPLKQKIIRSKLIKIKTPLKCFALNLPTIT